MDKEGFCFESGLARFGLINNHRFIKKGDEFMLGWTLTFLIIALIAGLLGFTGIAGAAVGIARILFTIFLVLFLATLVLGLIHGH